MCPKKNLIWLWTLHYELRLIFKNELLNIMCKKDEWRCFPGVFLRVPFLSVFGGYPYICEYPSLKRGRILCLLFRSWRGVIPTSSSNLSPAPKLIGIRSLPLILHCDLCMFRVIIMFVSYFLGG
jgi:hypothetical protein